MHLLIDSLLQLQTPRVNLLWLCSNCLEKMEICRFTFKHSKLKAKRQRMNEESKLQNRANQPLEQTEENPSK